MSGSPGSLLLLLLAVFLLLEYFTGRLDWLFSLGHDVQAGYTAPPASTTAPSSVRYVPQYRNPASAYA